MDAFSVPDRTQNVTDPLAAAQGLNPRQIGGLMLLGEIGARLSEAWQPELAQPLTAALQNAGQMIARYELPELLEDALDTMSALHRDGTFARMRDVSALLADIARTGDWDGLAVGAIQGLGGVAATSGLPAMLKTLNDLARAWQQSAVQVANSDSAKGGLIGLIHLLRDPAAQEFLQRVIVTVAQTEHPASPVEAGVVPH